MNVVRKEDAYKETYTVDDIYALPEGERAELIDSQIYYLATPSRTHQRILFSLSRKIADYIDAHQGTCEVDIAPFAVFLNDDNTNYIEPDISVICDKEKLSDRGCEGAPDWIIEIASPSTSRIDCAVKLFKYRTAGVREYWIVNPMKKLVQTYIFEGDEDASIFSFDDEIPVYIFDNGLTIKISDLL